MRSGELFAGVGGLGMAVDAVFGTRPAWFAEFDEAPSKVLAHRYPDVPNLGDVTQIDFRTAEHTHVRAGGFPCQDVSLAGRRKGMGSGTRSGLWSEFARSIEEDRPDWVVIENVRGLLSADAAGDVEPCPLCVGDDTGHVLRALGAVLGDLADLGFDAEWTGIRASDVGAPHGRFRVFILAWPSAYTDSDGLERVGRVSAGERNADGRDREDGAWESAEPASSLTLLPTPDAYSGSRGGSQHPEKRRAGGHTVSLADVTEHALLPVPTVGNATDGDAQRLLPTPKAHDGEFATPSTTGRPPHNATHLSTRIVKGGEIGLMPTPRASGGDNTDWGPYAGAIERWASVIGRPAPAPVRHDGKGGKPRLNPQLTEFMMGWPAGWVTDPEIGLTRAEQLKACGNGVVPQQASAALRELLARPGVPAVREAVAA